MSNNFISKFRIFFWISIFKTLYINLRLLPFKQAIKIPIIVTKATTIGKLSGKIIIKGEIKTGLVRFGILHSDLESWKGLHTYLSISGDFIINGNIQFGVGCKIVIDKNATLEMGNNIGIGSNTRIVCRKEIRIGDNFRAAWDVQIFDTNFHYIKSIDNGKVLRKTKPLFIGNNNWIGNKSSLMQGTITPDFLIVASNSICNKNYSNSIPKYSLIGGSPAKLIKTNVCRVLDREEKKLDRLFENVEDEFVLTLNTPIPR